MINTISYLDKEYSVKNNQVLIDGKTYTVLTGKLKNIGNFFNNNISHVFIDFKVCHHNDIFSEERDSATFTNCIFNQDTNLIGSTISDCIFTKCAYLYHPNFPNKQTHKEDKTVFYSNVKFDGDFTLDPWCSSSGLGTEINDKVIHPNLVFKNNVIFNNIDFQEDVELFLECRESANANIYLNKCKFNKKFKIRNVESNDYDIDQITKAKLNSLKIIDCTANENAYLRIGFLEVENFELKNLRNPQNAELNIGDCHFKNFKLTNFRNIGKFKLFKINILDKEKNTSKKICKTNSFGSAPLYILEKFKRQPPLYELNSKNCKVKKSKNDNFQIDNTSIGDTDFQSVNLSSFEKITMFDNIFDNVKYTNINWGEFGGKKDITIGGCENHQSHQICKLEKQQDTYRTLKNVAIKNNDQPQAIKFYAKEMENAYQLEQWVNFSNKFTLWFNKWTNSFGLSWIKPTLILLFVIAPFFYFLLLLSLDCYCQDKDILAKFFEFLNPTHKIGFVAENGWGVATYFIDIFFRIIEGLMIYQIIQAFRKYTRKL
jgi:hypothetical protein